MIVFIKETLLFFEIKWCGRRDLNPHELTLNRFSYLLRLSPPLLSGSAKLGLGSGLSLHHGIAFAIL